MCTKPVRSAPLSARRWPTNPRLTACRTMDANALICRDPRGHAERSAGAQRTATAGSPASLGPRQPPSGSVLVLRCWPWRRRQGSTWLPRTARVCGCVCTQHGMCANPMSPQGHDEAVGPRRRHGAAPNVTGWHGGAVPGGQGVAGSNPVSPTEEPALTCGNASRSRFWF